MKFDAKDLILIICIGCMLSLTVIIIEQNRNIKSGVVIISSQAFVCKPIPLVGNE
jgi:hypothetical protein